MSRRDCRKKIKNKIVDLAIIVCACSCISAGLRVRVRVLSMHTVLRASSSSVKADHVLLMRTCSCLRQPTCASTRISPRQGHVVSKRSTSSESHRPPQVIEGFESFQDVEGELRRRKAKSDFKKRKVSFPTYTLFEAGCKYLNPTPDAVTFCVCCQ